MAHVQASDTLGVRWLAEHAGRPVSALTASRMMHRSDTGARLIGPRGSKTRHWQVPTVSLQTSGIDVAATPRDEIDLDLVSSIQSRLGPIAAGLMAGKSPAQIADELSVSVRSIQLKIADLRKSLRGT